MKLVYKKTGKEVKVGDIVEDYKSPAGYKCYKVLSFSKPHKPSSSGKVFVEVAEGATDPNMYTGEYYVAVIGAEWIEREDRL